MPVNCYITEPNGALHQVTVRRNALGRDCFDSVCKRLHLVEKQYFGLHFISKHGLSMWLNVRNPIRLQLPGKDPYHMHLRVRFFVDPKLLSTPQSRNILFQQLYYDLVKGTRFRFDPMDDMSKALYLAGLMAQMDHGDVSVKDKIVYRQYFPGLKQETIRQEHRRNVGMKGIRLSLPGSTRAEAEMNFLHEVASWEYYTIQVVHNLYQVQPNAPQRSVSLGISDKNVVLFDAQQRTILTVPTAAVKETSYCDEFFKIKYCINSGDVEDVRKFKVRAHCWTLGGHVALHRLFWEMLEFYSSEQVRGDLLARGHRKLKGDLLSLIGMRTRAQFYRVFTFALPTTLKLAKQEARMMSETQKEKGKCKNGRDRTNRKTDGDFCMGSDLKAILTYVHDVLPTDTSTDDRDVRMAWHNLSDVCNTVSCLVCLQQPRSVRYSCGHVFCCTSCAIHLPNCAVCRSPTSSKSRVYMFPPLLDDTTQNRQRTDQ